MTATRSLLVIDDEAAIRRLLKLSLAAHGYQVLEAVTGEQGLVEAATRRPDGVILDLGLPDGDGLSVLQRLREWYDKPVLILSVRDDEASIVTALDQGADDYLTKPFNLAELIARLRVAERHHAHADAEPVFRRGDLEVDLSARKVTLKGEPVKLSVTEYDLLRLFVRHAGRVLTHAQILKEIWGPNAQEHREYLRVYVGHLRQKLEPEMTDKGLIVTEPGVGYRFG